MIYVHNAHRAVKAKRTPDSCFLHSMVFDDRPEAARRLEQARLSRGFKFAKDATNFFGWNYDTYAQHENGTRGITRAAAKYAKAFKASEAWLLTGEGTPPGKFGQASPGMVRLVGYIGAGQSVYAVDDGGDNEVEAPADSHPDTVAAQVRGDSMLPVFQEDWLIYWSKHLPAVEMINRLAVVQLSDGRIMVKTLRLGSDQGLWTLTSFNAADIIDVAVDWAAPIDWIKPR